VFLGERVVQVLRESQVADASARGLPVPIREVSWCGCEEVNINVVDYVEVSIERIKIVRLWIRRDDEMDFIE
jgi:hypothetical protein